MSLIFLIMKLLTTTRVLSGAFTVPHVVSTIHYHDGIISSSVEAELLMKSSQICFIRKINTELDIAKTLENIFTYNNFFPELLVANMLFQVCV